MPGDVQKSPVKKKIVFKAFEKQDEFIRAVFSRSYDFILYGGSIRGGKTIAILATLILLCRMYPRSKHVVCRSSLTRLKDTALPTFYTIVPDKFLKQSPNQNNGWEAEFVNGSMIKFYAENIDKDPELKRFRGLEYDYIAFDEMDITEKTFFVGFERSGTHRMNERESKTYDCPYGVIGTSNPQQNWVKKKIYDKWKSGDLQENWLYIRSSVWDNPHISDEWIRQQKANMPPLRYEMMMKGNWEVNLNQMPFFYQYAPGIHISKSLVMQNREPLWISFDFNYSPTVAIVGQKINWPVSAGGGCYVYAEYAVEGGTYALCQELKKYMYHPAGVYVTGDFSGSTRHTSAKNTDYQIIQDELNIPTQWFIGTETANKDFVYSRNICNYAFANAGIKIDAQCEKLILDLETAQVNDRGKLIKDRDQNKQDLGDAFRYLIDAWFRLGVRDINEFKESIQAEK